MQDIQSEANVRPKKCDETFKRQAVALLSSRGKRVARELGVTAWNLYEWRKRQEQPGRRAQEDQDYCRALADIGAIASMSRKANFFAN